MIEHIPSRRDFLRAGTAAGTAALLGSRLRADDAMKPKPTADTIILLWMAGGQAATEVWDMKKYTPFEKGMEAKAVYSTFKSIPTSVDGLQISEGLPNVAQVMHHGTLVKTFKAGDLGFILHSRHQYHWHTGYVPPQPVAAPHLGAVLAPPSGRAIPTCPPSSTSASARPAAKTSRSRPSRRPASSAIPTALSSCRNRRRPCKPCSRRPACPRSVSVNASSFTSRRSRPAATPPDSTPRRTSFSSRSRAPAG